MPNDAHCALPRWSIAAVSCLHAAGTGAAAVLLPWRDGSFLAVVGLALAVAHGVNVIAAVSGRRGARVRALEGVAVVSLLVLAALTWAMGSAALYVARLHVGLGPGIAGVIVAAWGLVVLFTVPAGLWAASAAGVFRRTPRGVAAAGAAIVLMMGAFWGGVSHAAAATPVDASGTSFAPRLDRAISGARWVSSELSRPSAAAVFECSAPPGPEHRTLLLATHGAQGAGVQCLQAASEEGLESALRERLARGDLALPIGVDVVTAVHDFPVNSPFVEALGIRPAMDGVCVGSRCLAPWQLVGLGELVSARPIPQIQDLRFGMSPAHVRERLGAPKGGAVGMRRLLVESFSVTASGSHRLRRLRLADDPTVDAPSVARAESAAQQFVIAAAARSGLFRYQLDSFDGRENLVGYNLPRQAGITVVLCEAGTGAAADSAARRSLAFMAAHERKIGDVSALARDEIRPSLGSSALPLIAFVTCRPREAGAHDALIGRLGKLLLRLQRDDGSFHPELDPTTVSPVVGPDPLYAEGQAVFALVLLEQLAQKDPRPGFPPAPELRRAVDRAMDYFGRVYWRHPLRDLFFIEENWHCLAARAALIGHRNDAYERFCIDYVRSQSRRVLAGKDIPAELVGGFGLGTFVAPHATPTAGFGEALAASIAIKRARGEDVSSDLERMKLVMSFLLRFQWSSEACFACVKEAIGGFAEQHASPEVRIDYLQHTWSAIAHGGQELGLSPKG